MERDDLLQGLLDQEITVEWQGGGCATGTLVGYDRTWLHLTRPVEGQEALGHIWIQVAYVLAIAGI